MNNNGHIKRQIRVRKKLKLSGKPRLTVYRSNKFIYAQIIDDAEGTTLISATQLELGKTQKGTKTELAKALGQLAAKKAMEKKIKTVVFDKGAYAYHGRVKAVAEGAREGGLTF